jgi:hypothetical protein
MTAGDFTAEAQRSQRDYLFSFPLRGRKTKKARPKGRAFLLGSYDLNSLSIIKWTYEVSKIVCRRLIVWSDFAPQKIRPRKKFSADFASLR